MGGGEVEVVHHRGRDTEGGENRHELRAASGHKEGANTTSRHGNMWEKRKQSLLVEGLRASKLQ